MKAVVVKREQVLNSSGSQDTATAAGGLTTAFIICYISILFSGISSMLMSVYLPDVVQNLLGSVPEEKIHNVSAYINSVFIFGSMFGGFAWGLICDRIGRSKAVVFSTALYSFFTILTAFSASWMFVGIFRFITGFGIGGVILTTNILIAEIWPERKRAIALGIVSAAMPVGFIMAGAMNNLVSDWHNAFLTGTIPLVTAIIALFVLPESPGWKFNKQQPQVKHSLNGLFDAAYKKNLLSGSVVFGAMLIGLWAIFSWAPTWVQSITADNERANQLRGIIMMVLSFSGLIGSMVSGWIVNLMGMRKTMMMCFAACFVMTFVVFKLNTSVSSVTLIEAGILAFFFGISQGALSVYIPSLFPTAVRASATGFCFNIGRLFTATVVFFIGALVSFLGGYGNAIFIFSFIFLIGLTATYLSKGS